MPVGRRMTTREMRMMMAIAIEKPKHRITNNLRWFITAVQNIILAYTCSKFPASHPMTSGCTYIGVKLEMLPLDLKGKIYANVPFKHKGSDTFQSTFLKIIVDYCVMTI